MITQNPTLATGWDDRQFEASLLTKTPAVLWNRAGVPGGQKPRAIDRARCGSVEDS